MSIAEYSIWIFFVLMTREKRFCKKCRKIISEFVSSYFLHFTFDVNFAGDHEVTQHVACIQLTDVTAL